MDNIENIFFFPLQDEDKISDWLNFADIHILPQRKEVQNLVFPSKLLGMMASGRPVIATSQKESDLGKIAEQIGIRVEPGDNNEFCAAINLLSQNKELRFELGERARSISELKFSKNKILTEFDFWLRKLS